MGAKPQGTQLVTKRWRCFNSRRLPLNYYFPVIGASGSLGSFLPKGVFLQCLVVFSCYKSLGSIVSNFRGVKLLAQGQPVSWQESACLNPSIYTGTSLLASFPSCTIRLCRHPSPFGSQKIHGSRSPHAVSYPQGPS